MTPRLLVGTFALAGSALAWAGTSALSVALTVNVVTTSGVCGTAGQAGAITVACVNPAPRAEQALESALTIPPLAFETAAAAQGLGGGFALASTMRKLSLMPATVLGAAPVSLYSSGATVGGFRTITAENGSYVEITIAW